MHGAAIFKLRGSDRLMIEPAARCFITMVALDESGRPQPVPGLACESGRPKVALRGAAAA